MKKQNVTTTTPTADATAPSPQRKPRGFAVMDPQRVREIAGMGGKAAHQQGHAHQWDSTSAREAAYASVAARGLKRKGV